MKNDISAQTSIPVNAVGITFSQPSNFNVYYNYGSGIEATPVIVIPNPTTSTCTVSIENSDVSPSLKCEYYDDDTSSWVNINTTSGIFTTSLVDSGGSNPHVWTYTINLSPSADLPTWGNREFKVELAEEFVDGSKNVLVMNALPFEFHTNLGFPPAPGFIDQPENVSLTPTGASFTTQFKAYNSSIRDSSWQYSDNYDVSSPGTATWTNIYNTDLGMNVFMAMSSGDILKYGGGGGFGLSDTRLTSTLEVSDSAYVPGRKYRFKAVAV
jgi:hypothetical protein